MTKAQFEKKKAETLKKDAQQVEDDIKLNVGDMLRFYVQSAAKDYMDNKKSAEEMAKLKDAIKHAQATVQNQQNAAALLEKVFNKGYRKSFCVVDTCKGFKEDQRNVCWHVANIKLQELVKAHIDHKFLTKAGQTLCKNKPTHAACESLAKRTAQKFAELDARNQGYCDKANSAALGINERGICCSRLRTMIANNIDLMAR